jgi:hypothetical protein
MVSYLIPRLSGSQRMEGRTVFIHSDDDEGMRGAVRVLAAAASGPD